MSLNRRDFTVKWKDISTAPTTTLSIHLYPRKSLRIIIHKKFHHFSLSSPKPLQASRTFLIMHTLFKSIVPKERTATAIKA